MPGLRFSPWSGTKILKAVQQGVWALDKGPGLCSQGLCRGVLGRACTLMKAGAGSKGLSVLGVLARLDQVSWGELRDRVP